jgi:hypothetical protein
VRLSERCHKHVDAAASLLGPKTRGSAKCPPTGVAGRSNQSVVILWRRHDSSTASSLGSASVAARPAQALWLRRSRSASTGHQPSAARRWHLCLR